MKSLIILLAMIAFIGPVRAQLNVSDAQYYSENYLINPSFEQGKKGWFLTDGTWSPSTIGAQVAHLKSAAAISISAETLDFRQTITVPAGAATLPGLVSVSIKTTVTELAFCVEVNNVTAECTLVNSDGNYHNYILDVDALGATNTILKIISFSAKTGDIYVDDAKIAVNKDFTTDLQDETGELILNSGFEKNVFGNVSCTNADIEQVDSVAGGKNNRHALRITATGTPWSCDIDGAGGSGTGFAQLQSIASVGGDAEFCILANGVEVACHESTLLTSQSETFSIPTVLDGTENSIRIKGTSASNVVTADKASVKAGQLSTTGYHREAIIDLTSSGDFTGGVVKITSNGLSVVVDVDGQLTHASTNAASSGVGSVPEWACPVLARTNISHVDTSGTSVFRMFFVNGSSAATPCSIGIRYYGTTLNNVSKTESGTSINLSYNLPEAQTVRSFNSMVYGSDLLATDVADQSFTTEATVEFATVDFKNGSHASSAFTIEHSGYYRLEFLSSVNRPAVDSGSFLPDIKFSVNSVNQNNECRFFSLYDDTDNTNQTSSSRFQQMYCVYKLNLRKGDVVRVRASSPQQVFLRYKTFMISRIMNPNGEPISGVFEGYPQFQGEENKRFVKGRANFGSATDGTVCNSSPCVRHNAVGNIGRLMSMTRGGAGSYVFTSSGWKVGASVDCDVKNDAGASTSARTTFTGVPRVANGSGEISFNISSITNNVVSGTIQAVDAYFAISCTGEAP